MGTFALNSGHGGTLRPVSLGVALLVLSGCKTLPTGPGETLASVSRQTAEAVAQQAAPRPSALASPPAAGPSGAGQGQGARPLSISPGELSTLQALFAKSTVTGKDLFFQLEKIRNIVLVGGSVASLMSPGTSDQAASAAFDPRAEVLRAAMATTEEVLAPYLSSIGVGAFGLHIASLTEDSGVMAKQTIKLPSGQGMSPAQMQRVVNMAAMIVASRATSKMLQSAIADFASVEADYRKLIERRESTAKVLYDVVTRAGSGSGGVAGLTSEDLRYLNETVRRMSVQQFSNDLGAQNLALAYLRATNQAAWSEYKVRSDSVRASTRGYIRTVAGVGAFAALLATFGNETLGAVQKQRAAELLGAFPFAWEFIKEVPPLLKLSWQVAAAGVVELPTPLNARRFRMLESQGKTEDVASTKEVFAGFKTRNAEALFNESLFRTGSDGLLYKLFRCDRAEVGRMIDTAVPIADRERFARDYLKRDERRFSFQNAFNAPAERTRERELGDELLRVNLRQRGDGAGGVALGEIQRLVERGARNWNNDQFLRLILANREGAAAHATLQLGELLVRPVPSMQSVHAYEQLIDECAQQLGGGPRATPPVAPPPPKPATPPRTNRPTPSPTSPTR